MSHPDQPTGQKRVLVIEDDEAICMLLQMLLSGDGFEAAMASTRQEIAAAVYRGRPDLILFDIHLTRSTNIGQVVGELRQLLGEAVPMLAMSAGPEEELARSLGAYAFVPKPFDIDAMLDQVRRGLAMRALAASAAAA